MVESEQNKKVEYRMWFRVLIPLSSAIYFIPLNMLGQKKKNRVMYTKILWSLAGLSRVRVDLHPQSDTFHVSRPNHQALRS